MQQYQDAGAQEDRGNVATAFATLTLPATFDFTAWHTLRIDVTGNATKTTLRGYLDGELKLSGEPAQA